MTQLVVDGESGARPKSGSLGLGTVTRGVRRHPLITFVAILAATAVGGAVWFFLPLPKMTAYVTFQISSQSQALIAPVGDAKADFVVYRQRRRPWPRAGRSSTTC